jgi:hypothetical protein
MKVTVQENGTKENLRFMALELSFVAEFRMPANLVISLFLIPSISTMLHNQELIIC